MSLFRRKTAPEVIAPPERFNIRVQYDRDGTVYPYDGWTFERFAVMIRERYQVRGEMPRRMWYVDDAGEETEITFRGKP